MADIDLRKELKDIEQRLLESKQQYSGELEQLQARIERLVARLDEGASSDGASSDGASSDDASEDQVSPVMGASMNPQEAPAQYHVPAGDEVVSGWQEEDAKPQGRHPDSTTALSTEDAGNIEQGNPVDPWMDTKGDESASDSSVVVAGFLRSFLETLVLGHARSFWEQLCSIYHHYKSQGKVAVFLMTVGGICAFVAGFGYALSYSFEHWFSSWAKVGLGFTAALLSVLAGGHLVKRRPGLSDYGSALVGLGIILNYLSIFFVTAHFGLVSAGAGFAMLAANSALAYVLALHYETRVVAIISLLGGAFSPFFLGAQSANPWPYLSYLLLLCGSAIGIAGRIQSDILRYLGLIVALVLFEVMLFAAAESSTAAFGVQPVYFGIALIHVYAYLFMGSGLFERSRLKEVLSNADMILAVGGITFLIGNLYLLLGEGYLLGSVLLANAIVIAMRVRVSSNWSVGQDDVSEGRNLAQTILIGGCAAIGVFAIGELFNLHLRGFLWAQEALLLLYIGLRQRNRFVRSEAYLIVILAFVQLIYNTPVFDFASGGFFLSKPFLHLVGGGVVAYAVMFLLRRYPQGLLPYEEGIGRVINEGLVVWVVSVWLVAAFYLWPEFVLGSTLIPVSAMLYRSTKLELKVSTTICMVGLLLIVGQLLVCIQQAGSFRFMEQSVYGKAAYIEVFAILWGLRWYFRKYAPESEWAGAADSARLLFYLLLPIAVIPPLISIARHNSAYFPIAIWGSVFTAYVLAHRLGRKEIWKEWEILFVLAIIVLIPATINDAAMGILSYGALGLLGSVAVLSALVWHKHDSLLNDKNGRGVSFVWSIVPFVGAWVIFACVYFASGNPMIAMMVTGIAMLAVIMGKTIAGYQPARRVLPAAYVAGRWVIMAGAVGMLGFHLAGQRSLAGVAIAILATALLFVIQLNSSRWMAHIRNNMRFSDGDARWSRWVIPNLSCIATYLMAVEWMFGRMYGPELTFVLLLHAMALIFSAERLRNPAFTNLAIGVFSLGGLKLFFYDLSGSTVIHKVIALLGVGLILLAGAYLYQIDRSSKQQVQ